MMMKKMILIAILAVAVAACQKSGSDMGSAALLALAGSGSLPGTTPQISSTTPSNGAVLTASTTTVVVNFSRAMNTTATQSAFSVSDGSSTITGTYAWSNGNATLTWTPSALTAWKVHTVTISSSAKAADGVAMSSVSSFTFRIGPFFTTSGTGSLLWQSGDASVYSVKKDWATADSYCTGYGMRLATYTEWSNGYPGNIGVMFNPNPSSAYWTSSGSTTCGGPPAVPCHTAVTYQTGSFLSGNTPDSTIDYARCVL